MTWKLGCFHAPCGARRVGFRHRLGTHLTCRRPLRKLAWLGFEQSGFKGGRLRRLGLRLRLLRACLDRGSSHGQWRSGQRRLDLGPAGRTGADHSCQGARDGETNPADGAEKRNGIVCHGLGSTLERSDPDVNLRDVLIRMNPPHYFWQHGHQYVDRCAITTWRMVVLHVRQGSPLRPYTKRRCLK